MQHGMQWPLTSLSLKDALIPAVCAGCCDISDAQGSVGFLGKLNSCDIFLPADDGCGPVRLFIPGKQTG